MQKLQTPHQRAVIDLWDYTEELGLAPGPLCWRCSARPADVRIADTNLCMYCLTDAEQAEMIQGRDLWLDWREARAEYRAHVSETGRAPTCRLCGQAARLLVGDATCAYCEGCAYSEFDDDEEGEDGW